MTGKGLGETIEINELNQPTIPRPPAAETDRVYHDLATVSSTQPTISLGIPRLLTSEAAAAVLIVCTKTSLTLTRKGDLPGLRVGSHAFQYLQDAVDRELLEKKPFKDADRAASSGDGRRQQFITRETALKGPAGAAGQPVAATVRPQPCGTPCPSEQPRHIKRFMGDHARRSCPAARHNDPGHAPSRPPECDPCMPFRWHGSASQVRISPAHQGSLADIKNRKNIETGADEAWELKDLPKTCATYYDEHVPESSTEILGHSVGGITYRHYAHRAPL